MTKENMPIMIIGAGITGATIAHVIAKNIPDQKIIVVEAKNHIAGNCHTARCPETNILEHVYGSHIFHTSDAAVWGFVNQFEDFRTYVNTPFARIDDDIYSLPVNLATINKFFKRNLMPHEAKKFVSEELADKSIKDPKNFEEQALKFMGPDLYYAFFYGYTKKHWGVEPKLLPASILKRIPLRFNYNNNYFNDCYQGIPKGGYTQMVENMLNLPNIHLITGKKLSLPDVDNYKHIFSTAPLDGIFEYKYGRLSYRTVYWKKDIYKGDALGTAAINYPQLDVPYTRQREHKHYTPWEKFDKTILLTEFSKQTEENDDPYYPINGAADKVKVNKYLQEVKKIENLTVAGRLGTYRYIDMHIAIKEAIEIANDYVATKNSLGRVASWHRNVELRTGCKSSK